MSSDYEDELHSDEDDDYTPSGKDDFTIYYPLEPPSPKQWSIEDLHSHMHQGLIDLQAEYQRDIVWPDSKKSFLIDSIFRNFYIPPVIFSINIQDDGSEVRVCVDGKQRLTSISRFMDGQIPYRDPKTKKNYWFTRGHSQTTRSLLPESIQKKFKRKQITCIEYSNLSEGDERDLFQRVQLGMSLTPAERLQAYATPITEWIRQLQKKFVAVEDGLQQSLRWNVARGRDFLGMAQLCFCWWHLPKFVTPTNSKLEKWFTSAPVPSKAFERQVQGVLESYVNISTTEEYQQGFAEIKERVAPVEFVMIGVLLAKMRESSWESRASQILDLRKHVRRAHKDIRSNERVMKTMWLFIQEVNNKGASFDRWEGPEEKKTTTARKTTRKRPREDAGDSTDQAGPSKKAVTKPRGKKTSGSTNRLDNGVKFVE